MERSLRKAMENLTALLLQKHLQASLDTNEAKAKENELIKPCSGSTISQWYCLLSSFAEVQQVLLDQGLNFSIKVLRRLTYRYAERARLMLGNFCYRQVKT